MLKKEELEKLTYPVVLRKCITFFQECVTPIRLLIYDGIGRFAGIAGNGLISSQEPNFCIPENCLLKTKITVELRYCQNNELYTDETARSLIGICKRASKDMVIKNSSYSKNSFQDKVNSSKNAYVNSELNDDDGKKDYFTMFGEAFMDESEFGKVLESWPEKSIHFRPPRTALLPCVDTTVRSDVRHEARCTGTRRS